MIWKAFFERRGPIVRFDILKKKRGLGKVFGLPFRVKLEYCRQRIYLAPEEPERRAAPLVRTLERSLKSAAADCA